MRCSRSAGTSEAIRWRAQRWIDPVLASTVERQSNRRSDRYDSPRAHRRRGEPAHPETQNGRSSSPKSGASSSENSRSAGGGGGGGALARAGAPPGEGARRVDAGAADGRRSPSRGGQMTPSHPGPPWNFGLLRHLKSGARGLRLLVRSSHIFPPQMGHAGSSAVPAGFAATGAAPGSRGGQMTPSHPPALHLKSGARGFFFVARLSHISLPQRGHAGAVVSAAAPAGCCSSLIR